MSGRLFNNVNTDFARFSGTPPVTASPVTLLVAAQTAATAAAQIPLSIASSTTLSNWRLGINIGGACVMAVQPAGTGGTAATANTVTTNTPFVIVGRERSTNDRDCILNGVIASLGTHSINFTVVSLDRVTLGKRDSTSNDQPFNGVIFYAAIWNVALSDDEVVALGTFAAPPPLIRPSALQCYWPNLGRSDGSTIIDILGRCPLTISGGSDSTAAMARVMTRAPLIGKQSAVVTAVSSVPFRPSRKFAHMIIR